MKRPLNSYIIVTNSNMHFLTQAKTNKEALKNLINNSVDFRVMIKDDEDLTITIKKA